MPLLSTAIVFALSLLLFTKPTIILEHFYKETKDTLLPKNETETEKSPNFFSPSHNGEVKSPSKIHITYKFLKDISLNAFSNFVLKNPGIVNKYSISSGYAHIEFSEYPQMINFEDVFKATFKVELNRVAG